MCLQHITVQKNLGDERVAKLSKLSELRRSQRRRCLFHDSFDLGLERVQQLEPWCRDARYGQTRVVNAGTAFDQTGAFETIEHARSVRRAAHQALGNFSARKAIRLRAAQDTEYVVLIARNAMAVEDCVGLLREVIGGHDDAHPGLGNEAGEMSLLDALGDAHACMIRVVNT